VPLSDDYGPAYDPVILGQVPEAATSEVIELRVVTTLKPSDDASKPGEATEKYFVNGKEILESKVPIYPDTNYPGPNTEKQSYGTYVANVAFVTDQADIKGSFPIRYFDVLVPN
jgi:hypothetical protein